MNGLNELVAVFGVYGVNLAYGENAVLSEISFELAAGEFLALIGPNGSGKSTLLKLVSGVLPMPFSGIRAQVRYRGQDFLNQDPRWRARQVAYLGSDWKVDFPLSAYDAVKLGRSCRQVGPSFASFSSNRSGPAGEEEIIKHSMLSCLCWEWRDRDLRSLSGGERQLVLLARALAQDPSILFLDETLSRIDLHHQAHIGKLLRSLARQGRTIVWVAHDLNLLTDWVDHALLLHRGRVVAKGPLTSVLTESNLEILYPGAPIRIGIDAISGKPKVSLDPNKSGS